MKACDYNMFQLTFPFDRFDSYACITRQDIHAMLLCVCRVGALSYYTTPKDKQQGVESKQRMAGSTCLARSTDSFALQVAVDGTSRSVSGTSFLVPCKRFLLGFLSMARCLLFHTSFLSQFFLGDGFGSWMIRCFPPPVFHGGCTAMNTIDV
jgi:hypothetical protein